MNFIVSILLFSIVLFANNGEARSPTNATTSWQQHGNGTAVESDHPSISTSRPISPTQKKIYKIVTVEVEPFVMRKRRSTDDKVLVGNDRYEGYCIDMMAAMAKYIRENEHFEDFEYEFYVQKENKYGAKRADGSWDGMIGDILNDEADAAVAPLTIRTDREKVIDFSQPFFTTGISIMVKKPDKREFSPFSFSSIQPLGMNIWLFILCSYIGVAILIFLASRISPYKWRRTDVSPESQGGHCNCFWLITAFMQQPRSLADRVASGTWWLFTLVIVASYFINLAIPPFLTLEKIPQPIESIEDLVMQNKIEYGIQQGGSTQTFFANSTVPLYQKMWQHMNERFEQQKSDHLEKTGNASGMSGIMVRSYAEGIEKVRQSKGLYAFLLEETANTYVNERKPCDTMKVGANLNSIGYGVATKKGSDLSLPISLAVLQLQENGELKRLENKWWYDYSHCNNRDVAKSHQYPVSLSSKVIGAIFILIVCIGFWLVTALSQYIFQTRGQNEQARMDSRQLVLQANSVKLPLRSKENNEDELNNTFT